MPEQAFTPSPPQPAVPPATAATHRRLHILAVVTMIGWWVLVETLNRIIAHKFGSEFIPLTERRGDTGELVKLRGISGIDLAICRALMCGCLAIPMIWVLIVTTLVAGHRSRRPIPWLIASALLLLGAVRMWQLNAMEAGTHILTGG